jgi:uncharacterized protein YecE (DUF72 family)
MRKTPPDPKTAGRARPGVAEATDRAVWIGISGWRYAGWRGKFYPKDLPQNRELEFASHVFNSIEINGSFYSLQRPSSYQRWYSQTSPDFLFSVKGAKFITHMKKLRDVKTPLANFFASGVLALGEKLGPILWQLPPSLGWNEERLTSFFRLLPQSIEEGAMLAKKHDDKLKARAWTKVDPALEQRRLRYALEIRHHSFITPAFVDLLRKHNIALVFADTAKKFPYAEDLTTDFVYCRLHGDKELYTSGYSDRALKRWAARIEKWRFGKHPRDARLISKIESRQWGPLAAATRTRRAASADRDIFVYFDNDAKVHAPYDAIRLAERLCDGSVKFQQT